MARFDIEIGKKGNGATEVSRSIDEIINKLANAEKYSEVFNNSIKGQQAVLKAYEGALKSLISQGFDRLDPSVKAVKAEIDKLTASLNTQKTSIANQKAIDDLNIKLKQIASNKALMSNETARATAQTRAFQAAINALIKNGVDPADKRIKDLQNSIANLGSVQTSVGGKVKGGGFMGGLVSQAGALIASLTSVYAILNTLKSAFNTAMTTDALETSFSFVVDDSVERLEALRESANRLGIEFVTLAETNKKFIAAAKASNFDLEKADKIFNSVANAGAKLKLSNEQISGTFLAIEQMISKGTVSMEELRRQLGDRLPGAFSMAAKAMGVTEAQFNKMVAAGEVMAKDLLPNLADELDKTYGNSQYQKIDSMQASLNRLKNTFTEFVMESNIASNVFAPFISGIETAIRSLSGLSNAADESYTRFKSTEEVFTRNKQRLEELVAEYSNAKQSAIETGESNDELRKIMNSIAEIMPGVVTSWDRYGNALDINLGKIHDMTEAQKELLRVMNRETIADISKPLNKALVQMEAAQVAIDRMTQMGVTEISKGGGIFPGDGYNTTLEEQRQRFKEAQADAVKYLKIMQDLGAELTSEQNNLLAYFGLDARGQAMRDYKKSLQRTAKTIEDAIRLINSASSKVELKELETQFAEFAGQKAFENALKDRASQLDKFAKEAESTLKRVREFLKESDFTISLLGMDDRGQAEAQIRRKYESMISSVKAGSDEYVRLNENMNIEIQASNQKFAEADAKLISDMVKRRAKAIQDQAAKIVADQEKEYQELLKAHQSYLQKVQAAEEKYDDAIARARKEGRNVEADELTKAKAKEISDIYRQEIEESDPFKALDESLKSAGTRVARQAIKDADVFVKSFIKGLKDPAQAKEISEWWEKMSSGMTNALAVEDWDTVENLANGFSSMAQSAMSFDGSMSSTLKTASALVKQVGSIASTISKSLGDVGSGLAKSGNAYAAIIGAVLSVAGSIVEIGEANIQKRRKAEQEATRAQISAIEAVTKALEYQIEIIDRLFGTERVKAWGDAVDSALQKVNDSLDEINKKDLVPKIEHDGINDYFIDLINAYNGNIDAMEKRKNDLVELNRKNKWNPFHNRGKVLNEIMELDIAIDFAKSIQRYELGWEKIEDITEKGAAEMRGRIAAGEFDEVTAAQISSMLDQWEIYKDAMRSMAEELTGISISGLISDATSLFFDSGADSANAWGEGFEKVMKQYAKKRFQVMYLEVAMKEWYDKMTKMAEDGLDASEAEILRRDWDNIYAGGSQERENLKNALGFDPFEDDVTGKGGKTGLRGAIERMSEQTGSELTGIYRASYEIDKESLNKLHFIDINMNALVGLNSQQLEVLEGIKEDTGDIAEHTSHLEEMKSALVEIAVNTRAGKGKSDRDNGVM